MVCHRTPKIFNTIKIDDKCENIYLPCRCLDNSTFSLSLWINATHFLDLLHRNLMCFNGVSEATQNQDKQAQDKEEEVWTKLQVWSVTKLFRRLKRSCKTKQINHHHHRDFQFQRRFQIWQKVFWFLQINPLFPVNEATKNITFFC